MQLLTRGIFHFDYNILVMKTIGTRSVTDLCFFNAFLIVFNDKKCCSYLFFFTFEEMRVREGWKSFEVVRKKCNIMGVILTC